MQLKSYALALAALAGVLALAATAPARQPSFFERWAYPWGPWTPDTPHVWGVVPPYEKRPWAYEPGVGTWLEQARYRGIVEVHLPDERGLLYVNGDPTPFRGNVQVLRTEVLPVSQPQVFLLRAAFRSGDDLLVEDRAISACAGEVIQVIFDGSKAQRVKLPARGPDGEQLPPPRQLNEPGR
jgi:hypothetical protein